MRGAGLMVALGGRGRGFAFGGRRMTRSTRPRMAIDGFSSRPGSGAPSGSCMSSSGQVLVRRRGAGHAILTRAFGRGSEGLGSIWSPLVTAFMILARGPARAQEGQFMKPVSRSAYVDRGLVDGWEAWAFQRPGYFAGDSIVRIEPSSFVSHPFARYVASRCARAPSVTERNAVPEPTAWIWFVHLPRRCCFRIASIDGSMKRATSSSAFFIKASAFAAASAASFGVIAMRTLYDIGKHRASRG